VLGNIKQQAEDTRRIQEMLASRSSLADNINSANDAYTQEAYGRSNTVASIQHYKPSELVTRTPVKPHWDRNSNSHNIDEIMEMRAELEDLINGDNPLNEFLSRVTVREMIKELRTDIRIMKYENELTELDIIKHLKEEADGGTKEPEPAPFQGGGFPGGLTATRGYVDEIETEKRYKTNPYTGQTTESSS